MKILVDENIPLSTCQWLRNNKQKVRDLRGTPLEGSEDSIVREIAQSKGRLLITTDKGFARHRSEQHNGILIILKQPSRQKIHERVVAAISNTENDKWPGRLVMMRDISLSTFDTNE